MLKMAESSNESSDIVPKKRKGVRNSEMYSRTRIKLAKIAGAAHTSHSGMEVRAIKTGTPCR